ncbi:hypothetical protein Scep_001171 [Stephania cephalantha]|uniref:X8 domain-containing protein n=1 Tax=Stephania cephalantha TaxID=152367 RepID=A0AAP0L8J6_9MAGN
MEFSTVVVFTIICSISLLSLTDGGQEKFVKLNLLEDDPFDPILLQSFSQSGVQVAVSVSAKDLKGVSSSVLMADRWVRAHVLTHFPSVQITTIVAGINVLCNNDYKNKWDLVLPSLKNIYHSLTWWGLEKQINVSAAFSAQCVQHQFFDSEFTHQTDLLEFLRSTNSTFSVITSQSSSPSLVNSIANSIKKIGGFSSSDGVVNVIISSPLKHRKLYLSSSNLDPYLHITKPPFVQTSITPLAATFSSGPAIAPSNSPPDIVDFPHCFPSPVLAPASSHRTGEVKGLWCVAKPGVPMATLQVALDYACGAGADCEEIRPQGRCYHPDTVVAHASYAFNNYWQKKKRIGATCDFGGTAMIISSDPSK